MAMCDDTNTPPDLGTDPLTPETTEKWLNWLEGVATTERDLGCATWLVLFELINELARNGLVDKERMVKHLQAALPALANESERIALRVLIDYQLAQSQTLMPSSSFSA
jgi:hypothetical protein